MDIDLEDYQKPGTVIFANGKVAYGENLQHMG